MKNCDTSESHTSAELYGVISLLKETIAYKDN